METNNSGKFFISQQPERVNQMKKYCTARAEEYIKDKFLLNYKLLRKIADILWLKVSEIIQKLHD